MCFTSNHSFGLVGGRWFSFTFGQGGLEVIAYVILVGERKQVDKIREKIHYLIFRAEKIVEKVSYSNIVPSKI